jgi:hypothetical protein
VGNGGGLTILIHNSVNYTNLDTSQLATNDQSMEHLAICADIGGTKVDICNIYISPASASAGYVPDFNNLLNLSDKDAINMGDFNAHHPVVFFST